MEHHRSDAPSQVNCVYNGLSRMRVSRVYAWDAGAGQWGGLAEPSKVRIFDGMDVVQERDSSNIIKASVTRGGNIGGVLARTTADTGTSYYGYDPQGNVTSLSDNTGAVVGSYAYDAWGNVLNSLSAQAQENPYRFSTKEQIAGLYHFGFRFYNSGTRRWLNRDPIAENGGINLYGFNRNNPIKFADPNGACPMLITGAIGAFGGGIIGAGVTWYNGGTTSEIMRAAGRGALIGGIAGVGGGLAGTAVSGAVGGGFLGGVAAGGATGVAGDLVGQGAEMALGWRQCYDWKQTALAGGLGGLTGGLSSAGMVCFTAGTKVVMADGSTKAIEQIKAGDKVMSRDEATGKTEAKPVKRTFERQVEATLVLHFSSGEKIETTREHPFYVEGRGFVPAGELGIGTSIVTRAGSSTTC